MDEPLGRRSRRETLMGGRGEAHGNAILSEDQVTKIYQLAHSGRFTLDELALAFGVSKPTIAAIKVGRNWKWLTNEKDRDA
jgi:hypothetical protein